MVSVSEMTPLWATACKHAGFVAGEQAVLYFVPGEPRKGRAAIHIAPGYPISVVKDWPLDAAQIADANSPKRIRAHRIVARDFLSPRVALGLLRHELEHAHQFERSPGLYLAASIAGSAIAHAFRERNPPCLDGSGSIYARLPSEEDANRAAAQLTNEHFGVPTPEELTGDHAQLFRDNSEIDQDTLGRRLLAITALFPKSLNWAAEEREEKLGEVLAYLGPDASEAWALMLSKPEISQFGTAALALCPSVEEIRTATEPQLAWKPVVEQIHEGRQVAEEALLKMPSLNLH